MNARTLFALTALSPLALNPLPAAAGSITVQLCSGTGSPRYLILALGGGEPGDGKQPCHTKGCHSGGSRKRAGRHI